MKKAYQFIDYFSEENLLRKITGINKSKTTAVFDLEDAFLIPYNNSLSESLKCSAREKIQDLINSSGNLEIAGGIRINQFGSNDFKRDLSLLNKLLRFKWDCIFLPKIEHTETIEKIISELKAINVTYNNLIPIIESKQGLDNSRNIIASLSRLGISKFAFGHCDFNLDSEIFPFLHPDSRPLLDIIKTLLDEANTYNVEYVNTPFLELYNSESFKDLLRNIFYLSGKHFSQVTLCKEQTLVFNSFDFSEKTSPHQQMGRINSFKTAQELIKNYEENKTPSKGFSIDKNKTIISPHEYIAAKKFTDKL